MSSLFGKSFAFLLVVALGTCLSQDPYDLLNGNGLFNSPVLTSFVEDPHHTISFLTVNSTNVLKLQKPTSSEVSFNNGLEYSFTASQPVHISFQFSSASPDTEDANLRLIDSTVTDFQKQSGNTVLLFRAGKAGFIRVNENQMISFYNSSVSTDSNVKTIKMDILLNWTTSTVNIFVNGEWKGSANFFQTATSVNKLRLYNLYQSTSYWKNLVVCTQNCYSFSSQTIFKSIGAAFLLLFVILLNF